MLLLSDPEIKGIVWLLGVIAFCLIVQLEGAVINQDPAGLPPPGLAPKGDVGAVPQATSAVNTASGPSQEPPEPLSQPTLQWPPPPGSAAAQQHESQAAITVAPPPPNVVQPAVQPGPGQVPPTTASQGQGVSSPQQPEPPSIPPSSNAGVAAATSQAGAASLSPSPTSATASAASSSDGNAGVAVAPCAPYYIVQGGPESAAAATAAGGVVVTGCGASASTGTGQGVAGQAAVASAGGGAAVLPAAAGSAGTPGVGVPGSAASPDYPVAADDVATVSAMGGAGQLDPAADLPGITNDAFTAGGVAAGVAPPSLPSLEGSGLPLPRVWPSQLPPAFPPPIPEVQLPNGPDPLRAFSDLGNSSNTSSSGGHQGSPLPPLGGTDALAAGFAPRTPTIPTLGVEPPDPMDALRAAEAARAGLPLLNKAGEPVLEAVISEDGSAPIVPKTLAEEAARRAWEHLKAGLACEECPKISTMSSPAPSPAPALASAEASSEEEQPRLGPPKPPECAASTVSAATASSVDPASMAAALRTDSNATLWPLKENHWAFHYPDPAPDKVAGPAPAPAPAPSPAAVGEAPKPKAPTGTVQRRGDEVIYHWCSPNVIVYLTKYGVTYYDDLGLTYRGPHDVVHWARNGEIYYQGLGGITRQSPDGSVAHWTHAGVVYLHSDGTTSYVPVGGGEPQYASSLSLSDDPFPGPPLTPKQVLDLVNSRLDAADRAAVTAGAPAPAPVGQVGQAPGAAPSMAPAPGDAPASAPGAAPAPSPATSTGP